MRTAGVFSVRSTEKSREEAEYKAMIAQGQAEEEYAVTDMTVRELVTEWLHVTASRIKESTAANYAMKAEKHLIPVFVEIKCCLLKAPHGRLP